MSDLGGSCDSELEHLRMCCRLCLQNPGIVNIFMEESDILFKLRMCTQLQIENSDGFPDSLCKKCVRSLENAYNFREKCYDSDRRLQDIFYATWQTKIEAKCETFDELEIEDESFSKPAVKEEESEADVETLVKSIPSRSGLEIKRTAKNDLQLAFEEDTNTELSRKKVKERSTETLEERIENDNECAEIKEEQFITQQENRQSDEDDYCADEKFNDSEEFLQPEEPQECTLCGAQSMSEQEFEAHINNHENETFYCSSCKKTFKGTVQIELHKKSHINSTLKIPCEFCGKTFGKYFLKGHVERVHQKKYVECKICHSILSSENALRYHIKRQHSSLGPVECNDCGKKFSVKAGLVPHIQRAHSNYRPHTCAFCPRTFVVSKDKKEHERVHTGVKPYQCPVCEKAFTQRGNMKSHFKHNHRDHDFKQAMQLHKAKKDH